MVDFVKELEQQLGSFDPSERKEALQALIKRSEAGDIKLPGTRTDVNLHFHSFYSYNACGYSPSKIAWLSRKIGLKMAGLVDFDVLDGLEEFLAAARSLGLKACGGMETRVFVPEFGDKVINSPGEPGIAYHVGLGFPRTEFEPELNEFKALLKQTARKRSHDLMIRINRYLSPLELDYEQDVCSLTPSGNATERHICLAYARKAQAVFKDNQALADFWAEKLDAESDTLELPEGISLLNLIRRKTMKQGGAGYVRPEAGSFPKMTRVNQFILAAGGIPVLAWLDGTSEGEQAIEELLEVAIGTGVAAINIIPNRNYTLRLGEKDQKCRQLYKIVELAEKINLPVIVGTEMNSPGQKFVDDFKSAELSPLVPVFIKGAHIVYAHSVLQLQCGLGYISPWAEKNFETKQARNKFFEELGALLQPDQEECLSSLSNEATPQEILERVEN